MKTRIPSLLIVCLLAVAANAQVQPSEELLSLQDNSFLLEEAYNQEAGVVQHIALFAHDDAADAWVLAFTQEYAAGSQKHQLSYTVPVGYLDGETELGDVAVHYRYQLRGDGNAALAITPRLSLILPTGDGSDGIAIDAGLPISRVLTSRMITHTNISGTWRFDDDEGALNLGQSVIYAASSRTHFMLEGLWTRDTSDDSNSVTLNPAIRWGFDIGGGKLVPGIGYAFGLADARDEDALLVYVSFEK